MYNVEKEVVIILLGCYNFDVKRKISHANQNIYIKGAIHPDRIMPEHDLVYIIEGSWEIYQDEMAYKLQADDVIFLHAGQHHYGLRPCDPNTKTMFIHVNNDIEDCFMPIDTYKKNSSQFILHTVIHCQNNYTVKRLFQEIISVFWSGLSAKESKISALFQLLLCELHECINSGNFSELDMLEKVIQIIHLNPQLFFTSKELADKLYVSERTLRNKFVKLYNQTLYQYQVHTKLQKACLLLKDYPKMKLREIAANLGFYDEFHFSKAFKKKYGLSPREFKELREEQNKEEENCFR
jgi:AraC-like DNA-binding protein